jgi:hypothetical protein
MVNYAADDGVGDTTTNHQRGAAVAAGAAAGAAAAITMAAVTMKVRAMVAAKAVRASNNECWGQYKGA